jgi:hypothetical protein
MAYCFQHVHLHPVNPVKLYLDYVAAHPAAPADPLFMFMPHAVRLVRCLVCSIQLAAVHALWAHHPPASGPVLHSPDHPQTAAEHWMR